MKTKNTLAYIFICALALFVLFGLYWVFAPSKKEEVQKPSVIEKKVTQEAKPEVTKPKPQEVEKIEKPSVSLAEKAAQRAAALQEIDAKIATGNPYRKEEAIDALAALGDPESISKIEKLTSDATPAVINHALSALGDLKSEKSIPVIKEVIEKNQERPDGYAETIRLYAVDALGNIPSAKSLEILSSELSKKDVTFNLNVTEALRKIGSKEAIPPLRDYRSFLHEKIGAMPAGDEQMAVIRAVWEEALRNVDSAINEIQRKQNEIE